MNTSSNPFDSSPSHQPETIASKIPWLTFRRGCPTCQRSYALDRIPRPFLLKYVLFFIPTRAFRCYSCQRTFIRVG